MVKGTILVCSGFLHIGLPTIAFLAFIGNGPIERIGAAS
jgi:hypothetical protein